MSLRAMQALQADLVKDQGIGYLADVLGRIGKRTRSGTESEAATSDAYISGPTHAFIPSVRKRKGKAERAQEGAHQMMAESTVPNPVKKKEKKKAESNNANSSPRFGR